MPVRVEAKVGSAGGSVSLASSGPRAITTSFSMAWLRDSPSRHESRRAQVSSESAMLLVPMGGG